jgi:hypothetical protein
VVLVMDPLERVARHDAAEARVAELMGTINAAMAALVDVIGEVLDEGVWETAGGIRSPEHWVGWQCGVSGKHAGRLVRMARRRGELPESMALFREGRVTEDVFAAIAARAPAARDAEIAVQAHRMLFGQVDRMLRTMPRDEPPPGPEREERPATVSFGAREGDRWVLHADLPLEDGLVLEKALTVGRSQVFRERYPDAPSETFIRDVTWADGLQRAAELALRQAAVVNGRQHRPSDRLQVWMHLDVADVRANPHLGPVVPDVLRRYLLCDADVRAVVESDGVLAKVSDRVRTVDDKLRAFVEHRDGGCAVPGCEQTRWLHIHHLHHWEDGGPTASWNLCALCPMHHRLHHRGLLEIRGSPHSPEGLRFFTAKGREIAAVQRPATVLPDQSDAGAYVHPSGEQVAWDDFHWQTLDGADLN